MEIVDSIWSSGIAWDAEIGYVCLGEEVDYVCGGVDYRSTDDPNKVRDVYRMSI